jgi:galactitol PTS system EIIA component
VSAFNEDLIVLEAEVSTAEDIISRLANLLSSRGYVKDSFLSAVLERERTYPTGLPSNAGIYVAIPHADPIHVNRSAIAVATLKEPVSFSMMGSPEIKVDVKLVIMLAIHNPEEHLHMLRNFMKLLQDKESLIRIVHSSKSDICKIFENVISKESITR